MKISNCIIITDENSVIEMKIEEQENFIGNRIFSRNIFPPHLFDDVWKYIDNSTVRSD
jgi:hypothetical protein